MCTSQQRKEKSSSHQRRLVGLPTKNDIICGRGRGSFSQPGNLNLQKVIERNFKSYVDASRKKEKSLFVESVLDTMLSTGARFVKKEQDGLWYEIDRKAARNKTAHAVRDHWKKLGPENRSSCKRHGKTTRRAFSAPSSTLSTDLQNFQESWAREEEDSTIQRSRSYSELANTSSNEKNPPTVSSLVVPTCTDSVPTYHCIHAEVDLMVRPISKKMEQVFYDEMRNHGEKQSWLLLDATAEIFRNAPDFC
eukprot:scaffold363_cov56-Cylindrotheca_fusiformis.AAC.13